METKDIIRNKRKENGLTMKQLADIVGVSEGTISRWESGEIVNIRKDKISALANALNISIPELMGFNDYPNSVGAAVVEICNEKNMTAPELAETSGISVDKLVRLIENNYEPISLDEVCLIATSLDVSISRLLKYNTNNLSDMWFRKMQEDDANILSTMTRYKRVPVYGKVAAGAPIEAIENVLEYVEIPASWSGDYAALLIKGDSMAPKIEDGDIIIVKLQDHAENGDIVVAIVNGADATCKKLIKNIEGITLQPLNPAYQPIYFNNDSINDLPVRIWGKVVENRARF